MRLKYFAYLLLPAVLLLSCNTEQQGPDVPEEIQGQVTSVIRYSATVGEGILTRAGLNNVNQYVFESGDQLYVVDAASNGANMYGILNLVAGAGDIRGTFEGDLMCLGGYEPADADALSATLVSKNDKIHTHADGKITGTTYPSSGTNAFAPTFRDAVSRFSDFRAQNTFGAHRFSLEQNSTFLIFSVTFNATEAGTIGASETITATLTNNGSSVRSGDVSVGNIDFSKQANFVAAFPAKPSGFNLQEAEISFQTTGGTPIITFDDITDATLEYNQYYEVTRSNVNLDFFTVQAKEGSTEVTFNYTDGNVVEYRTSDSGTWSTYSTPVTLSAAGDIVQFRAQGTAYNTNGTPIITADKGCFVYGNIMSLMCDSGWNPGTTVAADAFKYAFKDAAWIDIPAGRPLKLSATTLGTNCYNMMFQGCTSLTRTPEFSATISGNVPASACEEMFKDCTALVSAGNLPNTTVGTSGYKGMFSGCTSLITLPASISGTSGDSACEEMFAGCTSLANAPSPTSDTVGDRGYLGMFRGCTSLLNAPALPATTLGTECYKEMFTGCTSLISTPSELPSENLEDYCYQDMFNGCIALSVVMSQLPATVSAQYCYYEMFLGCISLNIGPEIMLEDVKTYSCYKMFSGCTSLVTSYGPEHATSVEAHGCEGMYLNCGELTSTPDELLSETLAESAYQEMYSGCAKITTAPNINATSVGMKSCYQMFYGCRRLRTGPEALAVPTVAQEAFREMFSGCIALSSAPAFTGMTSVGKEACRDMFLGCSNLTSFPTLPATTLSQGAYFAMFKNSGIKTAPELPATTLASQCYYAMFTGCKKLEGPILLPAPTLVSECYREMFNGASSLNSVVCLATDHSASNCTKDWLKSVSSSGTFVRPSGVSWNTNNVSAIPPGWTVQDTGIDPIFQDGGAFDGEEEF